MMADQSQCQTGQDTVDVGKNALVCYNAQQSRQVSISDMRCV